MTTEEDRQKEITTNITRIYHTTIEKNIEKNHDPVTMIILTTKNIIDRKNTAKALTTIEKEMIAGQTTIEVIEKATLVAADTIITITNETFQATNIVRVVKLTRINTIESITMEILTEKLTLHRNIITKITKVETEMTTREETITSAETQTLSISAAKLQAIMVVLSLQPSSPQ
jgi:hypothetical protein